MDDSFDEKSNQIRQLSALSPDRLIDHLSALHKNAANAGPSIIPHLQSAAINAVQFLNNKLPGNGNELAQDAPVMPSRAQKSMWLNLHDIVSNPLSVLEHVEKNTLNQHHIEALQSVYPDLHQEMTQKMAEHLGKMKMEGKEISYRKRMSIGMLMGQPLDSTQTVQGLQAILMANSGKQGQETRAGQKRASGVELKQINQVDKLYANPLQARQMDKRD